MSRRSGLAILGVGLFAAGCMVLQPDAGEGGMGLPRQLPGEAYPGPRQAVAGEVQVADNGCVQARVDGTDYLAVWPRGSALAAPVRLPDGALLARGDRFRGVGAFVEVGVIAAEPDGYWAYVVGFCAPDADVVLVLDEAVPEG